MMLMLFGFIFRGVAFEFRHLAQRESVWEWAFGFGSLVAAGAQGLALGGLLQGPTVEQGRFTGDTFDWLTPFSLLATGGVLVGYTLLGTTYLMIRMHGMLEDRLYRLARYLAVAMLAVAAAVSLWCPLRYEWIFDRWFSLPNVYYYGALPAMALFAFAMLFRSLAQRRTVAPFVWTLLIFVASFAGLGATFFPYLVPEAITVFEAAAAPNTLVFMLAIVSFFIPIMIFYNAYQYAVFSGKLEEYRVDGDNPAH